MPGRGDGVEAPALLLSLPRQEVEMTAGGLRVEQRPVVEVAIRTRPLDRLSGRHVRLRPDNCLTEVFL
jgi:hypothetical protein